jgi:hypothetical protein
MEMPKLDEVWKVRVKEAKLIFNLSSIGLLLNYVQSKTDYIDLQTGQTIVDSLNEIYEFINLKNYKLMKFA